MSKKNKAGVLILSSVLAFGAVGALASCGEEKPAEKVEEVKSITINNKAAVETLFPGQEVTLDVTVDPASKASEVKVRSSNAAVVTALGKKITAKAPGTAEITVTCGKITEKINVTVKKVTLTGISIKNADALKEEGLFKAYGAKKELELDITSDGPSNVTDLISSGRVTITSSDPTILLVNGIELVPLKEGQVTITAKTDNEDVAAATINLTVLPREKAEQFTFLEAQTEGLTHLRTPGMFEESSTGKTTWTKKRYGVTGVVVATDGSANTILYDGTTFIAAFNMDRAGSIKVGETIVTEGYISDYYGCIQLTQGGFYTGEVAEQDKIELPAPEAIEKAKLDAFKAKAKAWDDNKETIGIDKRLDPFYAKVTGKFTSNTSFEAFGYTFTLDKATTEMKNAIEALKFNYGDEIIVTGGVLGFNSWKGHFNFVPTAVELGKRAIKPESITLNIPATAKVFDTIAFRETAGLVTLAPEGAEATLKYDITTEDGAFDFDELKETLLFRLPGTYKIKVSDASNAKVASEVKTVTVTETNADSFFSKATVATTKTQMSVKEKTLYKFTGILTSLPTDKYGNAYFVGSDGKSFKMGVTANLTGISYDKGSSKFKYSRTDFSFKDLTDQEIVNLGDELELFVIRSGDYYNAAFYQVKREASTITYDLTLPAAGVTANKATTGLHMGDEVELTVTDKTKDLYFNGKQVVYDEETGKATITIKAGNNAIELKSQTVELPADETAKLADSTKTEFRVGDKVELTVTEGYLVFFNGKNVKADTSGKYYIYISDYKNEVTTMVKRTEGTSYIYNADDAVVDSDNTEAKFETTEFTVTLLKDNGSALVEDNYKSGQIRVYSKQSLEIKSNSDKVIDKIYFTDVGSTNNNTAGVASGVTGGTAVIDGKDWTITGDGTSKAVKITAKLRVVYITVVLKDAAPATEAK